MNWKERALEFAIFKLGTFVSIMAVIGLVAMTSVWYSQIEPTYCDDIPDTTKCEYSKSVFRTFLYASPFIVVAFAILLSTKFFYITIRNIRNKKSKRILIFDDVSYVLNGMTDEKIKEVHGQLRKIAEELKDATD